MLLAWETQGDRWLQMALPQMEPGGNIWTISLASGTEQHFQPSVGTSVDKNAAHRQLLTGPTAPPAPEALLTPTGWHQDQRCSSPVLPHPHPPSSAQVALKMSFSSTVHPLTPVSPKAAVGLPWEHRWGEPRGGNGCVFAYTIFSKGLNCYI